jgi:hypothetical protein
VVLVRESLIESLEIEWAVRRVHPADRITWREGAIPESQIRTDKGEQGLKSRYWHWRREGNPEEKKESERKT